MRNRSPLVALIASLLVGSCSGEPFDDEVVGLEQGLAITTLTLNPSTIAGGSGDYSTATITLDAPAPAGGVTVTLTSSNTDLAASTQSITVPQGATSKTFRVFTNAFYRRYSEQGFTATISAATAGGGTASATLTVTAQPMPPDIMGPDSDMDGLDCGGESPDVDVLMNCADGGIPSIPGPCHKQQECTLGCQDLQDDFTTLRAQCSTSGPFPFLLSPKIATGGSSVAGTVRLSSTAPAGTTASAFFQSIFATSDPGSFSIPTGATTASFAVATDPVSVSVFAPLTGFITIPQASQSGGTFYATRSALAWLAVVPAPGTPEVDLAALTVDPNSVTECSPAQATVTLAAPAPTEVQVFLRNDNTSIVDVPVDMPASVVVQPGTTSTTFTVNTRYVSGATKVVSSTATLTGVSRTAALTVTPMPPPSVRSVTLSPSSIVGGDSTTGTVTVDTAAPAGGAEVRLTSGHSPTMQVPPSVVVPAGQTSATFPVTTSPVTFGTVIGLTASRGCISAQTSLIVTTTPTLWSLSVSPASVAGGGVATGTVQLTQTAPSFGIVVSLSSSKPSAASVPNSVTVPGGQFEATFPVTTSAVQGSTAVTLTASHGSVTRTAALTVTAPEPPVITSSPVTAGAVGQPYSYQAIATGTNPITWSLVTAPAGMSISASGLVGWTPAVAGSFATEIRAQNSLGATTQPYTITVTSAPNTGLRSPTANGADSGGDGNGFEVSSTNAYGDDMLDAVDNNSGNGSNTSCTDRSKDKHRFYDYGFNIPAGSIIKGIEVRLDARADSTSGSPKMCVQLSWDGGSSWTSARSTATLGTVTNTFTLGGATDTWGRTWSLGNLTDTSFRIRISNVSSSTSRDFSLDWAAVRVHY